MDLPFKIPHTLSIVARRQIVGHQTLLGNAIYVAGKVISMSTISLEDFQRLDLRIGKILRAERIPEKKKIYRLQIDVGGQQIRTIAGGAEHYPPEYFQGRTVVVLLNLQPKVIGGIESKGMLLAADLQGKPIWLTVDGEVPAGTKVR